jgi:hypothetical protein
MVFPQGVGFPKILVQMQRLKALGNEYPLLGKMVSLVISNVIH